MSRVPSAAAPRAGAAPCGPAIPRFPDAAVPPSHPTPAPPGPVTPRRAAAEALAVVALSVLSLFAAQALGAHARVDALVRAGRLAWADELFVMVVVAAAAIGVFAWRRWRDLRLAMRASDAAVERARESERRLHLLVNQVPALVWTTDRELRFTSAAGGALEAHGINTADAVGRSLLDYYDADASAVRAHRRALAGEAVTYASDLAGRHFAAHVEPLRNAAGECVGAIGVALDDTERANAEAESRFQARLLASVRQGAIATDAQGRVVYWNHFATELYGWTAEEAVGRSILELTPAEQSLEESRVILEALMKGESWSGEIPVRRKDGTTFIAHVTDSPVLDEDGRLTGIIGISCDLTERRALEEQLRQAQKMEAVGRLAGGVAHDFNNLLTAINGYAAVLQDDAPEGSELRADLGEILKAGTRAAEMTRQLLAFSRRQVLQPRVVALNDVVRDHEAILRRLIGEQVELTTRLAPRVPSVRVDPAQLAQVLLNLAVNARDAMPRGGRLDITTDVVVLTPDAARRHGDSIAPGVYARLEVSDTGAGMDAETLARIFDPFFTTKPPGQGTGLGLATVYGVVKQSGGHVFAESEPGHGATFRIYLPKAVGEGAGVENGAAEPAPDHPATVLLAEDEPAVRTLACSALRRAGYTVLDACDGEEALAVALAHAGRIDLLVSDVVMPRVGGPELAGRLRAVSVSPPVLFMSGYADDSVLSDGAGGAVEVLPKPFTPSELVACVRSLLASAAAVSA
jgi:PAS domain S-box-containing protein